MAGLAGCAASPVATGGPSPVALTASPTSSPLPSAPTGSAYPPDAVLAAVTAAVRRLGDPKPVVWDVDDVLPGVPLSVCGLLMDGSADGSDLQVAADYAGHIRVNPIADLPSYAGRPTVVAQVDVAHLADDTAARAAVRTAVGARCDSEFGLFSGPDEAKRTGEKMRVGAGDARLTTGQLSVADPGARVTSLDFMPGAARLVFAYGPLVLDVLVLEVRAPDERPVAATAAARADVLSVASDIIWGLPK